MSRYSRTIFAVPALALLAAIPALAQDEMAEEDMADGAAMSMAPAMMEWGPAPPMLPEGGEVAVLSGDPSQEGHFVLRLKMPDGYAIAAHTHPTVENVTVLSGAVLFAHGADPATAEPQTISAGSFVMIPAEHPHQATAQGETEVQVHGDGPFEFTYLDPADDPRNQSN